MFACFFAKERVIGVKRGWFQANIKSYILEFEELM
jgi:hypothetical protein